MGSSETEPRVARALVDTPHGNNESKPRPSQWNVEWVMEWDGSHGMWMGQTKTFHFLIAFRFAFPAKYNLLFRLFQLPMCSRWAICRIVKVVSRLRRLFRGRLQLLGIQWMPKAGKIKLDLG